MQRIALQLRLKSRAIEPITGARLCQHTEVYIVGGHIDGRGQQDETEAACDKMAHRVTDWQRQIAEYIPQIFHCVEADKHDHEQADEFDR